MLKITQIATLVLSFSLLVLAELPATANKKDPCLKNTNGIGNNHNIDLELPTHSLTLNDSLN